MISACSLETLGSRNRMSTQLHGPPWSRPPAAGRPPRCPRCECRASSRRVLPATSGYACLTFELPPARLVVPRSAAWIERSISQDAIPAVPASCPGQPCRSAIRSSCGQGRADRAGRAIGRCPGQFRLHRCRLHLLPRPAPLPTPPANLRHRCLQYTPPRLRSSAADPPCELRIPRPITVGTASAGSIPVPPAAAAADVPGRRRAPRWANLPYAIVLVAARRAG